MTLPPGTRLGAYEILALLGAGGMGEVYKARDTRLDRTVAIKVISDLIGATPDLRQRFEREARSLSALNHPHICTLHDIGRHDAVEFLVLEYLEGETLAARLEHGALPLDEVIRRGAELADALDRAHRTGVVHRDLKPANIMLTRSGVKVLDFGLARLAVPGLRDGAAAVTTPGAELTGQGTILGTLQYMSPEQVSAGEVDARSDIFALGAVLFEMTTGRRPFEASSQAGLIAAILEHDVPSLSVSSARPLPPSLDRVVRRCLAKDPEDRWQSARDVVLELRAIGSDSSPAAAGTAVPSPALTRRVRTWQVISGALIVVLAAAAVAIWSLRAPRDVPPQLRLEVVTPPSPAPTSIALSPDGRHLVFVAISTPNTQAELWLRDLDTVSNQRLPGTEGATFPFWSADSRSIGFFAESKLQRYDLAGGSVQTLAPAPLGRGGTWNRDGVIVFAPIVGALSRISASGGEPVPLTRVRAPHETSHRFPQFLPDGRRFLYFVQGSTESQGVYLASLDQPEGQRLFAADSQAVFAAPDTIVFLRQSTAFAQRLDLSSGGLSGDPIEMATHVMFDGAFNTSAITASANGLIAYRTGSANELLWVDRAGKRLGVVAAIAPSSQNSPEISPDGRRVALDRTVNGNRDIWLLDLAREVATRFTFDTGIDATPLWSPDGARIAFRSNRTGVNQIYVKAAGGVAAEERLTTLDLGVGVSDWSSDGRTLLFAALDPATALDVWALPLTGDRKPFAVAQTPFEERDGQLSPDDRWVAYTSNASGRPEVYVQAFPTAAERWQVSTGGGSQPRWRGDGAELVYVAANGMMMAASFRAAPGASPPTGTPVALFPARIVSAQGGLLRHQYAVTADGQRFLLNAVAEDAANAPITLIANWPGFARP